MLIYNNSFSLELCGCHFFMTMGVYGYKEFLNIDFHVII